MFGQSKSRQSLLIAGVMIAFTTASPGQALAQEAGAYMHGSKDNQSIPDKTTDAWITATVKSEFGSTKGIPATGISVNTRDGVVTLSGNVGNAREKFQAMRVARMVKGVKSVDASRLNIAAESHAMPAPNISGH